MILSPKLIDITPALLNVYFINTGSNIGSISSPTFSSKTGYPSYMHYSNILTKSESLNLTIWIFEGE
jgi:hypothetical protein